MSDTPPIGQPSTAAATGGHSVAEEWMRLVARFVDLVKSSGVADAIGGGRRVDADNLTRTPR